MGQQDWLKKGNKSYSQYQDKNFKNSKTLTCVRLKQKYKINHAWNVLKYKPQT